jgi:succinoglycan biosynthesis protein ExoA
MTSVLVSSTDDVRARRTDVSDRPPIDVVVPAYNEALAIGMCLDSILAQDYLKDIVRIFVVDAGSDDQTVEIVQRRTEGEPRVVLLTGNGRLNAAEACNLGFRAGDAPLVARVDAHLNIAPDYLSRAADTFADEDSLLACVGGRPEHVGVTRFGRGAACARGSRFGVGASVYADRRARAYVDTVPVGVYRRAALDAVGGYATRMLCGEDEEMNWRLRRAGWKILLDGSLRFGYRARSSWRELYLQHRLYGQARARVIALYPNFLRPHHLAPGLLVGGGIVIGAAALVNGRARNAGLALAAAYASAALFAGRRAAEKGGEPQLSLEVSKAFTAMHLGYGVGFVEGAIQVAAARLGLGTLPRAVRTR